MKLLFEWDRLREREREGRGGGRWTEDIEKKTDRMIYKQSHWSASKTKRNRAEAIDRLKVQSRREEEKNSMIESYCIAGKRTSRQS